MLSYIYIGICMCTLLTNVCGSPWASPAQERLDEQNDAEIYNAVLNSVRAWERKHHSTRIKRDEQNSVCYPNLGCFEASGPFGYLDMLPSTPEDIATKFLFYPSHSKRRSGSPTGEVPFSNLTDAFGYAKQSFNKTLRTKVMIHGFGSDCSHIWVYEMRSALMAVEDVNVICVDWGNGATLPNYVKATANTRLVGKQLAMLLRGLVDQVGFSFKDMHLIGFSLGAHVAGFAGAELGNLSRITGLDPAGPLFESQDPRARLDQSDADFVDVIHSNGENLILGGLGSWQPMGHVDFYPNGGRMQKGCSNIFVGAVSDIIWSSAVEGRSLCNHRRAYKFFTDSVSPRCHFPAFPCDSYEAFLAGECFPCTDDRDCGNMGYYADRSKGRGQLYLITRDEEPFCAHQYHIKIESSPSDIPIVSYGKIQITLIGDSLLNETFTLTRKEDEEMKLGSSVSRIIVPHPILLEPTKIQILYNAYSGWLTSGLLQWRIDKITISDSFGRSSSVCKKNLILDSGVPVILPLYPGECNLPSSSASSSGGGNNSGEKNDSEPAEDRLDEKYKNATETSKFLNAAQIVAGESTKSESSSLSFRDAFEIFNIPWNNNDNSIGDSENEQSRAFNTRRIKQQQKIGAVASKPNETVEVVEPILKPSAKHGRSHDPKPEITEPILGPTTTKSVKPKPKQLNFNDDWVPKTTNTKWKRQDVDEEQDAFNAIVRTVQFLPQRLARMFEEAEKYARETILPFVSTYTPKFLSDIIIPPQTTPKYLPLSFDFNNSKKATSTLNRTVQHQNATTIVQSVNVTSSSSTSSTTTPNSMLVEEAKTTTTVNLSEVDSNRVELSGVNKGRSAASSAEFVVESSETTTTIKGIYVNLPVTDDTYKEIKYIPLMRDNNNETTTTTTTTPTNSSKKLE